MEGWDGEEREGEREERRSTIGEGFREWEGRGRSW